MEKHANLIAGEWVHSDEYSENISPADLSDSLGLFAKGAKDHVAKAVEAAASAQSSWVKMNLAERAGQIFRFFAGECLPQSGDLLRSLRHGIDIEVRREPVGVIGMITPWDFPIAIPAWKLAPASVYTMAQILVEAGLPVGVFNLVMGTDPRRLNGEY